MKKIILAGKQGRPSIIDLYSKIIEENQAITLALKLEATKKKKEERIKEFAGSLNASKITPLHRYEAPNSILIRWGTRVNLYTGRNSIVYNLSKAIHNSSNKKDAREIFLKAGVGTPKMFYSPLDKDITFPIIARPLTHSKGKHFVVIDNTDDFKKIYNKRTNTWYYSEFIDKTNEYRVHCAHGKVLGIMEKPKGTGHAWNRDLNEEPFTRVLQEDYNINVCITALNAIKALDLDFGGVDIMLKDDKAYVLEVNTCPSVSNSEYINKRYVQYFNWLLSTNERREHWDYSQFKKANSLAWKDNQLTD